MGYANWHEEEGNFDSGELRRQAERIVATCERRGLTLLELVRERQGGGTNALDRPGLGYAMQRIESGDAEGLVVAELACVTKSATELGRVLEWFESAGARLIAVASDLDTGQEGGRLAMRTFVDISRWASERVGLRTRLIRGEAMSRPFGVRVTAGYQRARPLRRPHRRDHR